MSNSAVDKKIKWKNNNNKDKSAKDLKKLFLLFEQK